MRAKHLGVFLALAAVLAWTAPALAAEVPADAKKQTKLGLYLTAREAYDLWAAKRDQVHILDVRTPEEYAFVGHAPMAVNIPYMFVTHQFNPAMKHYAMQVNEHFLEQVKARFKPQDTLLVMCRSGQRAAAAVNQLAEAGFKQVYNIVDGFEGELDKDQQSPNLGKRTVDGWRNSKAPWTYELDPALIYQAEKK